MILIQITMAIVFVNTVGKIQAHQTVHAIAEIVKSVVKKSIEFAHIITDFRQRFIH